MVYEQWIIRNYWKDEGNKMRIYHKPKKNKIKNVIFLLFLFICLLGLNKKEVLAAPNEEIVSVDIGQKIKYEGKENTKAEYSNSYTFTAMDSSNNMPEGSDNGVYRFYITGNGIYRIDNLTFTKPGIYSYKVKRDIKDETGNAYDLEEYQVNIYVKNQIEDGLFSEITVLNSNNIKVDGIEYCISYPNREATNKVSVKTGDYNKMQIKLVLFIEWIAFLLILLLLKRFCKFIKKQN